MREEDGDIFYRLLFGLRGDIYIWCRCQMEGICGYLTGNGVAVHFFNRWVFLVLLSPHIVFHDF